MEPIVNIADVVRRARTAALNSVPMATACPYPEHTAAADLFRESYKAAQDEMEGLAA